MRRIALFVAVLAGMLAIASPALAASGTPVVSTGLATNLTSTSATLTGTVDMNGAALDSTGDGTFAGDCYFEWGTSSSYGSTVACSAAPAANGTSTVTANISALKAGTVYDFQLVIVYQGSLLGLIPVPADADGGNASFTAGVPVSAVTGQADNIYENSATLHGTVNPGGATVKSCTFSYGTSNSQSALTQSVACTPTPSGSSAVPVSAGVTGLTASTTYYFQLTVTTASGTATGAIVPFTTNTAAPPKPAGSDPTAPTVGGTSATLSASLNPENVAVTGCTFNYGTSTSYGKSVACSPMPSGGAQTATANLTGLTPGTTYHYDVVLATGGGQYTSDDETFTTLDATTQAASNITATTALLNGTINPEGQTVSKCLFVYAVEGGQPQSANCDQSSIGGTSGVPVTASLSGLSGNTTYVYAVELQTTGGGTVVGGVQSFTTPAAPKPPTASTGAATNVTSSSAVLHAIVNANGSTASGCEFEYGVTPFSSTLTGSGATFGLDVACQPSPGTGQTAVSVALRGLAPNTTYYYRVLFATSSGYVIGTTDKFHTPIGGERKPGVRITKATISRAAGSARFSFKATGIGATKGQCALAVVRHGRVGSHRYKSCGFSAQYRHLAPGTYVFYVRLGDSAGYGRAASKRFTI